MAKKIRDGFSQTVRTDYLDKNEYPASLNYIYSVETGVKSLRGKLTRLVSMCPRTWIVLVGYSQGATVVGDTIDIYSTQLSSTVKARIKAAILLGDPRFRANQSYSAGTYDRTRSGAYPRPAGAFGGMASRVRSYCNRLDMFCQNNLFGGSAAEQAHGDYAKYASAAFTFAKSRY